MPMPSHMARMRDARRKAVKYLEIIKTLLDILLMFYEVYFNGGISSDVTSLKISI